MASGPKGPTHRGPRGGGAEAPPFQSAYRGAVRHYVRVGFRELKLAVPALAATSQIPFSSF
ncbi:hypothetical protein SBA2_460015 [Acidobacteriia bacterium SbA2]|nr:hypothetical protein SBA2_460015 [Acidobacteriia bacterium SbA2]